MLYSVFEWILHDNAAYYKDHDWIGFFTGLIHRHQGMSPYLMYQHKARDRRNAREYMCT